jgi:hypothetical protein
LLQMPQHHDRNQIADVKAGRRTVEPDIGRDRALPGRAIQRRRIGDLMNETARFETAEKVAAVGHGGDGFTVWRGACHAPTAGSAASGNFVSFDVSYRIRDFSAQLPRQLAHIGC